MTNKTFCPIMFIGFDPPSKGKRDFRLCMRDCAWYNPSEETCQINVLADLLQNPEIHANDVSDYLGEITSGYTRGGYHEPIGFDDEPGPEYYRPR